MEIQEYREMSDETLATCYKLLVNGRQFEGVDEEKEKCGKVMAERLGN